MKPPQIIHVPNPNHADREGNKVTILVVHAIAEWVMDGDWHCTAYLQLKKLSVHAFCMPDGRIVTSVDPQRSAYHAGKHNKTSIGMELMVAGAHNYESFLNRINDVANPPYTAAQYTSAGWWFRQQANLHGLKFADIKSHAQLDPVNKQDPGKAFDWKAFQNAFDAAGSLPVEEYPTWIEPAEPSGMAYHI